MSIKLFDGIHEKILEISRKHFLENGYERTSIRTLCKDVGITTGLFYQHFPDKSALFSELVEEAAIGLKHLLRTQLEKVRELTVECPDNFYKEHYLYDVPIMLSYIYTHIEEFRLIACSKRDRFRKFICDLSGIELEYSKRIAVDIRIKEPLSLDMLFFIHLSFYTGLFEAVVHNIPKDEIETFVEPFTQYYIAIWNSFIKNLKGLDLNVIGKCQMVKRL